MHKKPRKFQPRPDQVDYTHARWAPVINCVVRHDGRILIVRRSDEVGFYPGYWNGISGFLDDDRSLEQKVTDELREELGIPEDAIENIRLGEIFDQDASDIGKTWVVHPVLVDVATDTVPLDWEATRYEWVTPGEARSRDLLPGFDTVLGKLSLWLS